MTDAAAIKMKNAGAIAARERRIVVLRAVAVMLLYAAFGFFGTRTLESYAAQIRMVRASMAGSPTIGADAAAGVPAPSPVAAAAEVLVGARLRRQLMAGRRQRPRPPCRRPSWRIPRAGP